MTKTITEPCWNRQDRQNALITMIKTIKKIFNPKNSQLNRRYWTSDDYKGFLNTKTLPFTKIIDGRSKIEIWKRYMKLGPFYRFEKDSKSRLAGKLFFLLPF